MALHRVIHKPHSICPSLDILIYTYICIYIAQRIFKVKPYNIYSLYMEANKCHFLKAQTWWPPPSYQGLLGQFNDLAEKLSQHECTLVDNSSCLSH